MTGERANAMVGRWFKSSASAPTGCCVEVRIRSDGVEIRDSKWPEAADDPAGRRPTISVGFVTWGSFLRHVTAGRRAFLSMELCVEYSSQSGSCVFRSVPGRMELVFDGDEWAAFRVGVVSGQFDVPVAFLEDMKSIAV